MTLHRRHLLAATAALAAAPFPALAQGGDRAVVEMFYTGYLSASGPKDKAALAQKMLASGWQSIGDYSGKNKSAEALTQQIIGFHKLIPDLAWKIEELIVSGNTYVVRGRASGTPNGPLFGVDGKGKSFTILSIDIHKVENGKIVTTYHVEDWAGALRQLKG